MTRKPSRVWVLALLIWHLVAGFAAPLAHATMATHSQGNAAGPTTPVAATATAVHCALHSHSSDAPSSGHAPSGSNGAPASSKHNCCADDSCQCAAPAFAALAPTVTISFSKASVISGVVRLAPVATRADLFFRPPIA
ncbi:MAG TPA: hypothetical protein VGM84_11800 [Steroidobacteraceae bacterium]